MPFEQDAPEQGVPLGQSAHLPAPLQVPLVPQVVGGIGTQRASVLPAAVARQVPRLAGNEQVVHASVHGRLQQIPPTQLPLWQSVAPMHDAPLGSLQMPLTHLSVAAQAWPHVPQLFMSVDRSKQPVGQQVVDPVQVVPGVHWHIPRTQVFPFKHGVGHVEVAHMPFTQAPPGQAGIMQLPQ